MNEGSWRYVLSFFLTDILGFNGMEDAPAHIAEDPSTLGIFVGMDVAGSKILGGGGGSTRTSGMEEGSWCVD